MNEAMQAFAQRFSRGALIAPQDAAGLSNLPSLRTQISTFLAAATDHEKEMEKCLRETAKAYGYGGQPTGKPFPFVAGKFAVIPVHGTLLNRYNYATSYATGYNAIRSMLNAAVVDPDVSQIVLDVNSFGGQAAGAFEMAADIRAAREKKKITAIVDSYAFSAAYALASAASQIIMSPSAEAGSIGVVAMHVSFEKALAEIGIEVTFIHAGAHKVDGNPYQALSDTARASIQASVDKFYGAFLDTVAAGRGAAMDRNAARKTEARCYDADECVKLGLADAIMAPEAALASIGGEGGDTTSTTNAEKEPAEMSDNTEAAAQAAAEARAAERARVSGILGCEEAKGRESLAKHLATNTDLSVDAAKAVLAAAPKEAKPEGNLLVDAMNRTEQPNVGSDGGEGEDKKAEKKPGEIGADIWAFYAERSGAAKRGSAGKPN